MYHERYFLIAKTVAKKAKQRTKLNKDMIVAVVKLQFKQLRINPKLFWGLNGIGTHDICVSAAMLYQLKYEDQNIGSRPMC